MRTMTMSIAPPSARTPTNDLRTADSRAEQSNATANTAASSKTAAATSTTKATSCNNEIGFDDKSGLLVVRTVDIGTGEIVAQNPSEAYLRLAQAMIATVRADDTETAGSGILA